MSKKLISKRQSVKKRPVKGECRIENGKLQEQNAAHFE
ncbi:hypothetical protein ELI_4372 [Eubacterium callanderi]|uniref:Uncharacterized protein n=1 Tax=Eubacterium callanderi TaxID=53442 RepID=E3GQL9_9FIRM|nr:hypothetical protein ELI_4372 [Eubacterium callanderi]